jgi:hypothetical protein
LSIKYPRDLPLATRPSDLIIQLNWPGTPLPPIKLPLLDSKDGIDDSNRRAGYAVDGKKKQLLITLPSPPSDAPRSPGYSPSSPQNTTTVNIPTPTGTGGDVDPISPTAAMLAMRGAPFADTPFVITIIWEKKKVHTSSFHFRAKNKTPAKKVAIIRRKKVIDGVEKKSGGKRSSEGSSDDEASNGRRGRGGGAPPSSGSGGAGNNRQGTKRRAASPPPAADSKKKGKGANDANGLPSLQRGNSWNRLPSMHGGEPPLPDDTDIDFPDFATEAENASKKGGSLASVDPSFDIGRRRETIAVIGSYGLLTYCFMLLLTDIRMDATMAMYTLVPAMALVALARLLFPSVGARTWNGCIRTVSTHTLLFRIGLALSCMALGALLLYQHNTIVLDRSASVAFRSPARTSPGDGTTGRDGHFGELNQKAVCDRWLNNGNDQEYKRCLTLTDGLPPLTERRIPTNQRSMFPPKQRQHDDIGAAGANSDLETPHAAEDDDVEHDVTPPLHEGLVPEKRDDHVPPVTMLPPTMLPPSMLPPSSPTPSPTLSTPRETPDVGITDATTPSSPEIVPISISQPPTTATSPISTIGEAQSSQPSAAFSGTPSTHFVSLVVILLPQYQFV